MRPDAIDSVEVRGSTTCIGVCDIAEPKTGLEGKFSLRATTAMALLGDDTSDPAIFNDDRMRDPTLLAMRNRIVFAPVAGMPATRATVLVRAGGGELTAEADTGRPASDLDAQWAKLSAKFFALAEPVIGRDNAATLHRAIEHIEDAPSMRDITSLVRPAVTA